MEPDRHINIGPRVIVGLFVIGLGIIFTLDNLGLFDAGRIISWWPLVLVAIGLTKVLQGHRGASGWVLILIGAWLLAANHGLFSSRYWPVLLILLGLLIVRGAFWRQRDAGTARDVSGFALLAGMERKISSQEFRGGDAAAVLGGCNIDLRQARIAGEEAVLDVFAMWGGIEIWVPETWSVAVEAWPILAGVEDKTRQTVPDPAAPKQRLVIRGLILMGGLELKN